jgi:hypothetical protein
MLFFSKKHLLSEVLTMSIKLYKILAASRPSPGEEYVYPGCIMKTWMRFILFCSILFAFSIALVPLSATSQDKRWVLFSHDQHATETQYYYDKDTVTYMPQNRVNVWIKIVSSGDEELIQTEIECFGRMFRTIAGPKPFFMTRDNKSYVAYGWVNIPPNSEVYLLSKIVCKPPAKDYQK